MPARLLPALVSAIALSLAGTVLPATTAAADTGCAPVIDAASVSYFPSTLAVSSKGYKTQQASGSLTSTCAEDNGSDLRLEVILSPDNLDLDSDLLVTDDEAVYPSDTPHSFGAFTEYEVHSGDLHNADAGTWRTEFSVTDTSKDASPNDYDSVDGPTIKILRESSVSAKVNHKKLKKGHTLTVKGKLTRANWDTRKDGAFAKQSVKLQFRAKGSDTFTTVATVKGSSKGRLKVKVKVTSDGWYRFTYGGSSTTSGASSTKRYVDVK